MDHINHHDPKQLLWIALTLHGVLMQTIERMGKWAKAAMYKSYLKFYKPEGLLAAGEWPIEQPHGLYWAPRFLVKIPEELTDAVFPFYKPLRDTVKAMGDKARGSHRGVVAVLEYLAKVLVQDALHLARRFPDDPVHALLRELPAFM